MVQVQSKGKGCTMSYRITFEETKNLDCCKRRVYEEFSGLDLVTLVEMTAEYMGRKMESNTDYEIVWWNSDGDIERMYNGSVECGWY